MRHVRGRLAHVFVINFSPKKYESILIKNALDDNRKRLACGWHRNDLFTTDRIGYVKLTKLNAELFEAQK